MAVLVTTRLPVATWAPWFVALSLAALGSCHRAGADEEGSGTSQSQGGSTATSQSPVVVTSTDTIFSGCQGGFTGGGRETAITGRGEVLARDFELPNTPVVFRTVGTDSAAAVQLFQDLDRARFRAMKHGEPSNATCSVTISDARGRYEVLFTPGSIPAALQPIIAKMDTLADPVRSNSAGELRSPDPSVGPATASTTFPDGGLSNVGTTGQSETRTDSTGSLVPVAQGLSIVSALHFPDGDRENQVVLSGVAPEGVTYTWRFDQHGGNGPRQGEISRFVSANDLASAPRLNAVFQGQGQQETPGYTAITISRATYRQVVAAGKATYAMTNLEDAMHDVAGGAAGGLLSSRLTYRGQLTSVSPSIDSVPVMLAGRRTKLPARHLHGAFAFQDQPLAADLWVLADTAHPLILKTAIGNDVFQTIRIDFPTPPVKREESELERNCRMELPGVYFAFNSAELDPASEPALTGVATLLQHHSDWTFTIEGHTDSIGTAASNAKLSTARAEAVRSDLVARHGVAATRLTAVGFGATRPRESNATIEGRARNRRVELARQCANSH